MNGKTAANPIESRVHSQLIEVSTLLRAARFEEAEQACRQALAVQPAEPTALHLLGVCLLQQGRHAEAEQALAACLKVQPGEPAALGNRGIALQGLGRFDEALACYAQSLARAPQQPATLNMQGLALLELRRFDEALQSFDRAVALAPSFAEAWCSRANALIQLRRHEQALASLDRAEALRPDYGEALSNRSLVLNLLGRHGEALSAARRALALLPGRPGIERNLADALAGLKRFDEALPHYDRAIERAPDGDSYRARARVHGESRRYAEEAADLQQALKLLGEDVELRAETARALAFADRFADALAFAEEALRQAPESIGALDARAFVFARLKNWPRALADYERLLQLQPDNVEALFDRATVLNELGRSAEALAAFDDGLRLQPKHAVAIYERALVLVALGRYEEAIRGFEHATEVDPGLTGAEWNEAVFRLLLGDFEIGWRKYESRWQKSEFAGQIQPFNKPRWNGNGDVAGKTILLHAEQGLGDVIQFCRYAPLLVDRGARVIVAAHAPLKPLLTTLRGVSQVICNGEPIPAFDLYSPLMSLPMAFATRIETVPAEVPYLHADPARVQAWKTRLGPSRGIRVGLAWSGDPRHARDRDRSIPLKLLEPLLDVPAAFFCLSKFVPDGDAETMRRLGVQHHGDELTDFAETAALASLMDVVVSVDTSIAHLAGALGLPLWLLIADPPEWRWMLERSDSPWYPTAGLFRQARSGDWSSVIAQVVRALEELAAAPRDRAGVGAP